MHTMNDWEPALTKEECNNKELGICYCGECGVKFTKEIETAGTSLQGYVETTKADLVRVFGSPDEFGEGDKVTIEWGIRFDDQTIATIYDWKRYELGTPEDDELMTYNVGGLTHRAVELVALALHPNK